MFADTRSPLARNLLGALAASLFVYDLDLLVDYLAGEAIDRYVYPVMLFAFDEETCKSGSVRRSSTELSFGSCPKISALLTGISLV